MQNIKIKLMKIKSYFKDKEKFTITIIMLILLAVIIGLLIYIYNQNEEYKQASDNSYNQAFYELINYIEDVETYLAKATITSTAEHGAETLTNVWNKSNLAAVYLSELPITTEGLSTAEKFLNQLSDYSYTLSMKTINGEDLADEDLSNLEDLYKYAKELKEILNQLANEINDGTISWKELTSKGNTTFAEQVGTTSSDSFGNIESTFDDYTGLIYDGAFSEHMTSTEKRGLTGEEITEEEALQIAKEFTKSSEDKITSNGLSENGNIASYSFSIDENRKNKINCNISKRWTHSIYELL